MVCWLPYAATSIAETAGFTPTSQVYITRLAFDKDKPVNLDFGL